MTFSSGYLSDLSDEISLLTNTSAELIDHSQSMVEYNSDSTSSGPVSPPKFHIALSPADLSTSEQEIPCDSIEYIPTTLHRNNNPTMVVHPLNDNDPYILDTTVLSEMNPRQLTDNQPTDQFTERRRYPDSMLPTLSPQYDPSLPCDIPPDVPVILQRPNMFVSQIGIPGQKGLQTRYEHSWDDLDQILTNLTIEK